MAIVPLKKIRLIVHREGVEKFLGITQRLGVVEFKSVTDLGEIGIDDLNLEKTDTLLNRINQVLRFLEPYEIKSGRYKTLREGSSINLMESQLMEKQFSESDLLSVLHSVKEMQDDLSLYKNQIASIDEKKEILLPWINLNISPALFDTKYTKTVLIKFNRNTTIKIPGATLSVFANLENLLIKEGIEGYVNKISDKLASITVYKTFDAESSILQIIKAVGAEIVILPNLSILPADEIANLDIERETILNNLDICNAKIADFSQKNLNSLRITYDVCVWKRDRQIALGVAKATKNVAIFDGWCVAEKLPLLENEISKSGLLCQVLELDIIENEEPPVELKNNAFVKPFEIITRLNGLPGYKDLDPTPFMAVFFLIFFGFSLTDVGYGVILMLLSLPFVVYFVVSEGARQAAKLIFMVGLSTAIIGAFFGSYFGINTKYLPDFLLSIQTFDPIANPLPVFYLALALGVIQIMFGIFLRIVSEAKNGRLINGLLTQGTWLFLFVSLILYGASVLGYLTFATDRLQTLVYIAVISVFLGNGSIGETIGEKIKFGLLSLYNSVSYFSDILSYSRLLALCLATSALAFAVNLIAGIMYDLIPYVGVILALFVLVIGHAFTIAVNTLGAFIHSARLQFVEFFGKFIAGTGREFKPLSRKESFINVIKDSG